ncbi:MAG: amidase [Chloroflexi bacterium]|nr:amidase [Chloroflexota bacterium]MBP8059736.1 amidase [Chloroflexota bacterium]
MFAFPEYESYDGLGLAGLVRKGDVSPLELVEAAIDRIEARNPHLNAVVHKMYDGARHAAAHVPHDAPFAGVPFLLKDLLSAYAGVPLTNGCRFFKNYVPQHDSMMVQRYKAAGLLVLGKTNTPEFGITPVTESELLGTANNPWDVKRTTGGSSGGSAAAVAARCVPLAHGGDGGGSIRIPASCCGVFGLKPTRGRNPSSLPFEPWQGNVCEHVITRSVRDSAAMLDATTGPTPGAPYFAPPSPRSFLSEVNTPPGRLRIAFTLHPFLGKEVDDTSRAGLAETVKLCQELGHELVEDYPRFDGPALARAFLTMLTGEIHADIVEAEQLLGRRATVDDFERDTWALHMLGSQIAAAQFVAATRTFQRVGQIIGQFFTDYDVLLTPTLAAPPVLSGSLMPQGAEATALRLMNRLGAGRVLNAMGMIDTAADRVYQFMPYTTVFNVTGNPAMSMPLYWSEAGLPIGMQFVGRYADEATLFRLAGQLEQAKPWFNKAPALVGQTQEPSIA